MSHAKQVGRNCIHSHVSSMTNNSCWDRMFWNSLGVWCIYYLWCDDNTYHIY